MIYLALRAVDLHLDSRYRQARIGAGPALMLSPRPVVSCGRRDEDLYTPRSSLDQKDGEQFCTPTLRCGSWCHL